MSGALAAIRRAAADVSGEILERLQAGIRIPSVNPGVEAGGTEAAFQQAFAAGLDDAGCRVEMWEPDADAVADRFPEVVSTLAREGYRGRPNLVGWLPSDDPPDGTRAHLILNSHADTVSAGDHATWRHPPLAAHFDGDTIYGLGAADAKGCLFTFLGAVLVLRHAGIRLRRSVMIQSVVDEEWGGAGVLDCLWRGYTAATAVVGEPTSLAVCPASRGMMGLRLRVFGRRAHPGEGWRGVNAIRKAWQYVEALDRLRDDLDRTQMHPLWAALPSGHVWNLMGLASGTTDTKARSVPDVCDLNYSIGLIGLERPPAMRPVVEAALHTVTSADPWLSQHPPELTWLSGFDPGVTEPGHPVVSALASAVREVTGSPATVQALSAGTDGRHLTNAGGIPAVNFGPGQMHLAHSPLESLPVHELIRAIESIALFLSRYCEGR